MSFYLKLPSPFNTFLFDPQQAFTDFTFEMDIVRHFSPYTIPNDWVNYLPLAYLILFPFSFIKNKLIAYSIFALGFLTGLTYLNTKTFTCENLTKLQNFQNIFIISVLSYPVLFILDRGNFDMLLFFIFAGFIYAFKAEKYLLSAALLAFQNAIKPFSVFFLLLFLYKKRYKEFFLSLILTALLIIGGFMLFKGGLLNQIAVYLKSIAIYKYNYVYLNEAHKAITNSSSLFILLKFMLCEFNKILSTVSLDKIYMPISLTIAAITAFFTWREKLFWKQITLLTLIMILLPYVSSDYKLIFLFVPIWLFINEKAASKFDTAYTILFGLLMIYKPLMIFSVHAYKLTQLVTLGIIVNPIIIMLFIGLIIFEQFYAKNAHHHKAQF